MRELVFTLTYEPGCNAVAETLAEYPDAGIRSLSLHATPGRLWRAGPGPGAPQAAGGAAGAAVVQPVAGRGAVASVSRPPP